MPAPAADLTDVAEVDIGNDAMAEQQRYGSHICARTSRGQVHCWGNNEQRQLGTGERAADSAAPTAVAGLGDVTQVALGAQHSCALTARGQVLCWGGNAWGQAGLAGGGVVERPTVVEGIADATQLAATNHGTCVLTRDHRVYCWGAARAELVKRDGAGWSPKEVEAARGASHLATSGTGACAILAAGQIACWRDVRSLLDPAAIVGAAGKVETIADAVAIAVGDNHGCALRVNGEVWCFGIGELGELGGGPRVSSRQPPARVALPASATQIVAGSTNTCARLEDQRWFCWGGNIKGQIGPRSISPIASPEPLDLTKVELASD